MNNLSASYRVAALLSLALFMLLTAAEAGIAQVPVPVQPDTVRTDTSRVQGMSREQQERMRRGGGPPASGGQQPEQEGQVNFQARDSLTFSFGKNRVANLYGSSKVIHSAGELSAGKISMNLDRHLVKADTETPEDTLSQPVLTRDNEKIRSNKITFNYQTEQGRFEVARVNVDQGNLIGEKVKNTDRHTVFIENGIYSTCTLDHPHYYLKADRMKVVNEEEVFFTRARLYILDIPYPLVFPFGYVPAKIEQKQSGLLQPTYAFQETSSRGLGLQNLGWFQYFNDNLVGEAAVDIFTSGTFFLDASANYNLRNKFSGGIQVGYSRENSSLEPTDPAFTTNVQKRIRINHQQTISPYASFSTNINLSTADYFKRNSYDPEDRAKTSTSSSLNYRYRHPENLYNFSISAQQNQNFRTNTVNLTGPNINFSLKQLSPFSGDRRSTGTPSILEGISIRYQNELTSNYRFRPTRGDSARINWFDALFDPSKYRQATGNEDHYRFGIRHQAGINFGNLLPSRFLNVSASANYNEYWFPTSIRKTFNPDSNRVETEQIRDIRTARDFNTGLSFSTTVYGIMNKRIGSLDAFRHTVRPSLSFSYRPDFGTDFWGYYREVQTDTTGRTQTYSIFEDEVFRGPGRGEQRALSLSLNNVFEAKQVSRDSTGEKRERNIRLIDQLNFQTSYNFAADSLKLSDLNANFSTSVVEGVNIRANARFGFYQRSQQGREIDQFLWEDGGKLIEPLSWSVSASTSFPSGRGGRGGGSLRGGMGGTGGMGTRGQNEPYFPRYYDPLNQSMFRGFDPRFNDQYVQPLDTDWRVSLNFSYRWTKRFNGEDTKSAVLNAQNISFKLTPKWDFSTNIGYDFIEQELTPSRFRLTRQLHCWSLSFEMNPFGDFQYYFFRLSINSGQIQGLLQKLPGLNNLQRSSSPTGRGNPRF